MWNNNSNPPKFSQTSPLFCSFLPSQLCPNPFCSTTQSLVWTRFLHPLPQQPTALDNPALSKSLSSGRHLSETHRLFTPQQAHLVLCRAGRVRAEQLSCKWGHRSLGLWNHNEPLVPTPAALPVSVIPALPLPPLPDWLHALWEKSFSPQTCCIDLLSGHSGVYFFHQHKKKIFNYFFVN